MEENNPKSLTDALNLVRTTKRRAKGQNTENSSSSESLTTSQCDAYASDMEMCGVIESLYLQNFMCHEKLMLEFRRGINVIQGRNGSGKSAIITAIIVGLGGTARFTNRGAAVKELIRHGASSAVIQITFRNNGRFAYKQEIFGNQVIVERRLVRSGHGGGYRIMTQWGKVVSEKKEDISRFLTACCITVDNPVTLLTQDASRTFLKSASAQSLFKIYMQATQLQKVKDDIDEMEHLIMSSRTILKQKRSNMPDIKKELHELEVKVKLLESCKGTRQKLASLKAEMLWAEVIEIEKKIQRVEEFKARNESNINSIQQKLQEKSQERKNADETQRKISVHSEDILAQLSKIEKERDEARAKVSSIKSQADRISYEYSYIQSRVQHLMKDVEAVRKKSSEDHNANIIKWKEERSKLLEEVNSLKTSIEILEQEIASESVHLQNAETDFNEKKSAFEEATVQLTSLRGQCKSIQNNLSKLKEQQGNQLAIFGSYIPAVLEDIESAYRQGQFHQKPIGPTGAHIIVKEEKWIHIAEQVIGSHMRSFITSCPEDAKVLKGILLSRITRRADVPIIVTTKFRKQLHDVSRFETGTERYKSLWSVLQVDDVVVGNFLLDQFHMEATLLVPSKEEAASLLKNANNVPSNCRNAYTLYGDLFLPDPNYAIYSGDGSRNVRYFKVSVSETIGQLEVRLNVCALDVRTVEEQGKEKQRAVASAAREYNILLQGKKTKEMQRKEKGCALMKKQEAVNQLEESPPPDLSQLENLIKETETELEETQNKACVIKEQQEKKRDELKMAQAELKSVCEQIKENEKKADAIKAEIEECSSRKAMLLKEEKILSLKADKVKATLDDIHQSTLSLTEQCNNKKATAQHLSVERINTDRSLQVISSETKALEKQLQKEQELHGDPIEIMQSLNRKSTLYRDLKENIDQQNKYLAKMICSLGDRKALFNRLKSFKFILVNTSFESLLMTRNLKGNIDIDYGTQALNIQCIKATGGMDKENYSQSLSLMSGGERSFATVSFVLALWDILVSPFKILDEFDIFMDNISRKQCLNMIITAAKSRYQYILLTPLAVDSVSTDKVSLFRMPSPERETESAGKERSSTTKRKKTTDL